ncbi:MAG TPA: NADH-quinone oxidoreductase subunit C [Candidatus Thioglobus sp.]|jgi:NADH-quinone oxidoreductase subunit C|nr:NADH-quinone oxidoreductase subunit C [Candidatus Thioglobus sp.]HIL42917.1 NADH-quinone oxidoreductase subunit C [Gammaproteobacteria bacterium]
MINLKEQLIEEFGVNSIAENYNEITLTVESSSIVETCLKLRDRFSFDILIDLCGVDYSTFGSSDWQGSASSTGFSRARKKQEPKTKFSKRFAVVYHLLSVSNNNRVRVKSFVDEAEPIINSVTGIWSSADWYEREAFDLMGILFENHTDLRRILTDYGFKGHPLRKDFPLIGEVEMRYDEVLGRVVYEPVSIEPNINVPRVIRDK